MTAATDTRLAEILARIPGNSSASQRARIVTALQEIGPLTTLQIQTGLDIPRPGSRMCELRSEGASIKTFWTTEETPAGFLHRFARYVATPASTENAA